MGAMLTNAFAHNTMASNINITSEKILLELKNFVSIEIYK
jgi:hypothetical protein